MRLAFLPRVELFFLIPFGAEDAVPTVPCYSRRLRVAATCSRERKATTRGLLAG